MWLAGRVDVEEGGGRVALFARLRAAGLAVPDGYVLGRDDFESYARHARSRAALGTTTVPLPRELASQIAEATAALGFPLAIRRSPLGRPPRAEVSPVRPLVRSPRPDGHKGAGRPHRETYLHLVDVAEVNEAVRRIWSQVILATPEEPCAVLIQRFAVPDASARVRPGPDGAVVIESCYGVGDLLSAGLVVPDRHVLVAGTGAVIERTLGRKTQMSLARPEGGVVRVPVPVPKTRVAALSDATLAELARAWVTATEAVGPLALLGAAIARGTVHVTNVRVAGG